MSHEDRIRRATRRALSSSCALLLTLALGTTQLAAQATGAAPTQTDEGAAVEPGMPLAADALRAELARLELELATTRDFATAEPALAELMQRVLRAGEFDGWQALLADVYVARIDLLLDMDRVEEAGELAGQLGAERSDLPSAERDAFRARVTAIADAPQVVAARARVHARHEGGARGGADLRRIVEEALAAKDSNAMLELGSLAVPVLLDLLEPDARADRFSDPRRDPLYMLVLLEPENSASLLWEAVPAPTLPFLRRLCSVLDLHRPHRSEGAWVSCGGPQPEFAWVDWLPWFARIVRRSGEDPALAGLMQEILWVFLLADVLPEDLVGAMRDLMQSDSVEGTSALSARLGHLVEESGYRPRGLPQVRVVDSLDPLRDLLWTHPDVRFRRIGAVLEASQPDLGDLRFMVDDPDPIIRERLAGAFGPVQLLTHSHCPSTHKSLSRSLRDGAILRDGDDQLLAKLAVDPDRRVQLAALKSLASGRVGPLPAQVARTARETGSSTVRAALLEVRWAPEPEWLALIEASFDDDSPAVRLAAAEVFGRADTPSSVELIERLVGDPDPRIRAAAVPALVQLGDAELMRRFLPPLAQTSDRELHAVVTQHLSGIREPQVVSEVLDALLEREAADDALGRGASNWFAERLRNIGDSGDPALFEQLVLREMDRRPQSELFTRLLYNDLHGRPSQLTTHPVGLRVLVRLAIGIDPSVAPGLWEPAVGTFRSSAVEDRQKRGEDDPFGRDLRWSAWRDLEVDELNAVLDAYERRDVGWIGVDIVIDRLAPDRLRALLGERSGGYASWYGWLRLARGEVGDAQLEAIGRLAALAGSQPPRTGQVNPRWSFESITPSVRAGWLADRIESGMQLETLDRLFEAGILGELDLAGEMGGARRRLVTAAFKRWGESALKEPEAIQWRFLSGLLALAASDEDVFTNDRLMELALDERALDACWPAVESRRSVELLPLLQHMFANANGRESSIDWGNALAVMRSLPSNVVEPLLLDLAERTTSVIKRDACLTELEQRARVRDARAAYESRQRDAAAHARALTEVLALLDDDDWTIRAEAARALGALGGAEQLPRLIALLRDEGAEVRKAAREAIERIHGRDAPAEPSEPEEPVEAPGG